MTRAEGSFEVSVTPQPTEAGLGNPGIGRMALRRAGSFSLLHRGTMDRGASDLSITVVPDSGTDGLTGLTGSLLIRVEGGRHFYEMDYFLPDDR